MKSFLKTIINSFQSWTKREIRTELVPLNKGIVSAQMAANAAAKAASFANGSADSAYELAFSAKESARYTQDLVNEKPAIHQFHYGKEDLHLGIDVGGQIVVTHNGYLIEKVSFKNGDLLDFSCYSMVSGVVSQQHFTLSANYRPIHGYFGWCFDGICYLSNDNRDYSKMSVLAVHLFNNSTTSKIVITRIA